MVLKLEPTQVDCSELEIIRQELGSLVTDIRQFVARMRENPEFYNDLDIVVIAQILEETVDG